MTLLMLFACNDDSVITASIEGRWKGTRAEVEARPLGLPIPIRRDVPSFDSPVEFRPDGTMTIMEGTSPEGTWYISGDELTLDIDYTIEDVGLAGTYTIETLTETTLVMYLVKRGQTLADPDNAPAISGRVKVTLHFRRQ